MRDLIYTFRTNKLKDSMESYFGNLFILGKLKKDLEIIKKRILNENPRFVVGCALSDKTCIELMTFNKFNKGIIEKSEKDSFNLFLPEDNPFKISRNPGHTFCNWTMYQLSKFIYENHLKTKLIFIHFKEEDYEDVASLIRELS